MLYVIQPNTFFMKNLLIQLKFEINMEKCCNLNCIVS